MKRTTPILMLVLMLLLTAWMMPATAEENPTLLTLYEGPKTMTTSATAKVTANGNDLFVYDVWSTTNTLERQHPADNHAYDLFRLRGQSAHRG